MANRTKCRERTDENQPPKMIHVDADGPFNPGKPLRSAHLWRWEKTIRPDGEIISRIADASPDTLTTAKYEAAFMDPQVRAARAVLRVKPDISIAELRKEFPELDKRCSDTHFERLRRDRDRSTKKFEDHVIAEASGYLEEETVYRYLKSPRSRQIKKARPGRPAKK